MTKRPGEFLFSTNAISFTMRNTRVGTINTTGAAKGILRLPHRWQRVVHNASDYIEGQYNFETYIYFVSVVNKYLPLLKFQPS